MSFIELMILKEVILVNRVSFSFIGKIKKFVRIFPICIGGGLK